MVHDEAPQAAAPAPAAAAPVAAPVAEPTLHDFVLNLLRDPSAQQAFDLDPTGCLKAAGLHDLTPADVHDVIPLVTDLVPGNGFGDLTSGLALDSQAGLDGGWAKASGESALGDFDGAGAVNLDGTGVGAAGYAHVEQTPLGDYSVGAEFDNGSAHTGLYAGALGSVEASFDTDLHFDTLDVQLPGAPELHLADSLPNVTGLVPNLPGLPGGGLPDVGDLTGLVPSLPGAGLPSLPELPGLPDVGHVGDLAKGLADPTAAASALAGAVPALPALPAVPGLAGLPQLPGVPGLSDLPVQLPSLPSLPEAPVAPVNHAVDAAQGAVDHGVDGAQSGQLPDLGGHLPSLPGLPVHLPNLPVDLPHLPVHLPQLPIDVPQLPNLPIGDASGHGPVGDIVDHTGLGGVINNNPVTDVVHDIAPDLHLGL